MCLYLALLEGLMHLPFRDRLAPLRMVPSASEGRKQFIDKFILGYLPFYLERLSAYCTVSI